MNIDFPNSREKECLSAISKKQNFIMFLAMKIALVNPKIYDLFFQIYFEFRRLKNLKWGFFIPSPATIPHFLVIGFPKAGTTSMHEYLLQHPNIIGSWAKETHFFSYGYNKGLKFYFKFFKFNKNKNSLYFESSPEYIYYIKALKRIKKLNPKMKLIVCLRNPIDLSFSSYNQLKNLGFETESFEKVLLKENYKLELHTKRLENDVYTAYNRPIFLPYLYISEFVTYIKNTLDIFDKKNIFFVDSCDLKNNTQKTMNEIFEFLGLETHKIEISLHNKSNYSGKLPLDIRKNLSKHFQPFNQELEKLLNKKFNWN